MFNKKSLVFTSSFLLLTVLDILLTFIGTPDLTDEGNPISAVFEFGWIALIITNLIALVIFALFSHMAFVRYKTPKIEVDNFFEFYLMLFYNTKTMVVKPMFKLPKNWMPFFAMISYAACIALIAGRIVVVAEWIAILLGYEHSAYFMVRVGIPLGRTDIWVFVLAFLISVIVWMEKEFKKVRKYSQNCTEIDN
ncbi:MAG: hypothetical protein IKU25_08820 [Clostridia bacterium]|nr:hypothetical protein [Clostridia bacterium]